MWSVIADVGVKQTQNFSIPEAEMCIFPSTLIYLKSACPRWGSFTIKDEASFEENFVALISRGLLLAYYCYVEVYVEVMPGLSRMSVYLIISVDRTAERAIPPSDASSAIL